MKNRKSNSILIRRHMGPIPPHLPAVVARDGSSIIVQVLISLHYYYLWEAVSGWVLDLAAAQFPLAAPAKTVCYSLPHCTVHQLSQAICTAESVLAWYSWFCITAWNQARKHHWCPAHWISNEWQPIARKFLWEGFKLHAGQGPWCDCGSHYEG